VGFFVVDGAGHVEGGVESVVVVPGVCPSRPMSIQADVHPGGVPPASVPSKSSQKNMFTTLCRAGIH